MTAYGPSECCFIWAFLGGHPSVLSLTVLNGAISELVCAHVSLFVVLRGMRCFPYCTDRTLDRNGFNGEVYFVHGLGECHPPRRGHFGGAARTWVHSGTRTV